MSKAYNKRRDQQRYFLAQSTKGTVQLYIPCLLCATSATVFFLSTLCRHPSQRQHIVQHELAENNDEREATFVAVACVDGPQSTGPPQPCMASRCQGALAPRRRDMWTWNRSCGHRVDVDPAVSVRYHTVIRRRRGHPLRILVSS